MLTVESYPLSPFTYQALSDPWIPVQAFSQALSHVALEIQGRRMSCLKPHGQLVASLGSGCLPPLTPRGTHSLRLWPQVLV